jgi:hypothetical protein
VGGTAAWRRWEEVTGVEEERKKGKYKIVEKTMTCGTHSAVIEWGKWTF